MLLLTTSHHSLGSSRRLLLFGDQSQQLLFDCLWNFDEFCAFSHDICFLDSSSCSDVVANGVPLLLFDDQVLASFVEDAGDCSLLFELLDLFDYFLGGELELVRKVFQ